MSSAQQPPEIERCGCCGSCESCELPARLAAARREAFREAVEALRWPTYDGLRFTEYVHAANFIERTFLSRPDNPEDNA